VENKIEDVVYNTIYELGDIPVDDKNNQLKTK
jgi:hypothetical protein